MVQILEDKSYKKVVQLKPERRQSDMFGNSMPDVKVVVMAVNPHHIIVQLLKDDQPDDQFRLISNDEQTPFELTDFEVYILYFILFARL